MPSDEALLRRLCLEGGTCISCGEYLTRGAGGGTAQASHLDAPSTSSELSVRFPMELLLPIFRSDMLRSMPRMRDPSDAGEDAPVRLVAMPFTSMRRFVPCGATLSLPPEDPVRRKVGTSRESIDEPRFCFCSPDRGLPVSFLEGEEEVRCAVAVVWLFANILARAGAGVRTKPTSTAKSRRAREGGVMTRSVRKRASL